MLSLFSGCPVAPCLTHPKLKRLPDSQPSGASLISFEKSSPAFCSFQLKQSQNCAMSEVEATTYAAGLNHLIRKQSRDLAGAKVLYWYKDPVPPSDDVISALYGEEDDRPLALDDLSSNDPSTVAGALQRMRDLLDAIQTGKRSDLAGNEFYVLTMAGNRGRAVVRDWQEGSYDRLLEAVAGWLNDTAILLPSGVIPSKVPGIQRLVECTLPSLKRGQKRDDWLKRAQHLRASLWRAAISNRELPQEIVYRLVPVLRDFALTGALESCFPLRRNEKLKSGKKEKDHASNNYWLLWQRMALLKAYHLRKRIGSNFTSGQERNNRMAIQQCLNPDHPSPAYHCGRLMAVLANVQREALGDVGAGVIQRYYAAASATPGLVFGRLIRNTQYHIDKVRSKKDWLADFFNRSLAEICCRIGQNIPKTLSLEDQSLFALGFYQQMAKPWKNIPGKAANGNGIGTDSSQTNSEENTL
jgi:CRISPR-associated protein Csd1